MAAHPAPEQRAILSRHDPLVPIGIGFAQLPDPPVADVDEFLVAGVKHGKPLVLQLGAGISEHLRKGEVAIADPAVFRHHQPDRRIGIGQLGEIAVSIAIIGTYFHDLAPFAKVRDASEAS